MQQLIADAASRYNLAEVILHTATEECFAELVRHHEEGNTVYAHALSRVDSRRERMRDIMQLVAGAIPPQLRIHADQVNVVVPTLLAVMFPEVPLSVERRVCEGVLFLRAIATD